jgi:hypothetical protein
MVINPEKASRRVSTPQTQSVRATGYIRIV